MQSIWWLLALLPILSLLINVLSQIVIRHSKSTTTVSIILGVLSGLANNLLILIWLRTSFSLFYSVYDVVASLLTYFALSFCYWAFLNLNLTSLRIRTLRELLKSPSGLSTDELLEQYSTEELIKRRLKRLHDSKQIKNVAGKWLLQSRKLLIFVFILYSLRKLIIPKHPIRTEPN